MTLYGCHLLIVGGEIKSLTLLWHDARHLTVFVSTFTCIYIVLNMKDPELKSSFFNVFGGE